MHSTYIALLRAICEDPAADLPRLALADHLEESGEDSDRAAFIRAQIALAHPDLATCPSKDGEPFGSILCRIGEGCPRCQARRDEDWLFKDLACNAVRVGSGFWGVRGPVTGWSLNRVDVEGCGHTFRRGFVHSLDIHVCHLFGHETGLFSAHPIESVRFWGLSLFCRGGPWHLLLHSLRADVRKGLRQDPRCLCFLRNDDGNRGAVFDSDRVALETLSDVVVACGRRNVGLPPLAAK